MCMFSPLESLSQNYIQKQNFRHDRVAHLLDSTPEKKFVFVALFCFDELLKLLILKKIFFST